MDRNFENQKILVLTKDLMGCPKGRIFKETIDGGFFHFRTTDEVLKGEMVDYLFTRKQVENNPEWFREYVESDGDIETDLSASIEHDISTALHMIQTAT